mmetsp:Transcript_1303/g.2838  ORF Transcript_1303/g.2838 Transcript_1303/m.2838 type:complete len:89 (+) Transcript_1303:114-380(+)|eukprot:CAMPEP_0202893376 /NCGR_PEP_ID=MMETSP1392-20130828/2974_1 /ASSEMBLY_ACC=CAM_ASM_000868 /TAXON_ID=225041 /ORGANISM="Chlamydomonas chlamydogama, Strain SAG 11-48b" /LENGTH=88 /DNA_ID=CAMNT_0049577687 /DNA_START=82 /DNA_END=348 /DNA_ORIENTATION=-
MLNGRGPFQSSPPIRVVKTAAARSQPAPTAPQPANSLMTIVEKVGIVAGTLVALGTLAQPVFSIQRDMEDMKRGQRRIFKKLRMSNEE